MKKSVYLLLAFATVAFTMVGCSKKKGGGTAAYAPGVCFNGMSGMNGYNNFGGGYGMTYQWRNGQCVDVRTGMIANQAACAGVANNYSYNSGCNYYGGNNYFNNGTVATAYNACSVYNNYSETFYPVFYPNLGITVCAGYSAYNTMLNFGIPSYYPGYTNVFQGCIVSDADPRCQGFGGTMGWFHGGVQLGVYFGL